MNNSFGKRTEKDFLGELELPWEAAYGLQTARALQNFPIAGVGLSHFPTLVNSLAAVKAAAAMANRQLGVLSADHAAIILAICDEIRSGLHHEHFVVDLIQGGAGTSTNMNANEVIANLGLARTGRRCGDYAYLHPNDHVNRSQSTNDVYPTAIRVAILSLIEPLCMALADLKAAFTER